jgi:hypothetical protein
MFKRIANTIEQFFLILFGLTVLTWAFIDSHPQVKKKEEKREK